MNPFSRRASSAAAQTVPAGTLSARQIAAVNRAVRAQMTKQQIVGAAVGIIQNGRVVYLNGYGWADRERGEAVNPNTLFRWASIPEALTTVAAMQLAEKSYLSLNTDVRRYVPEFPDKGVVITPSHLLAHQSGLPHYNNGKVIVTKRQYPVAHPFEDVVYALDTFKESPLLYAPGEKFSLSTYAYILLSAVVQRAGRQKFADQVTERIAAPLGITTLQPDYQWVAIPNRAAGYFLKGTTVLRSTDSDESWKLGGAGWVSNVEDLARFAQGLITRRLVSDPSSALMWQPQRLKNGAPAPWGLGFKVTAGANSPLKVEHDGRSEKSACRMVLFPTEGHGVVVMTNGNYAVPDEISTAIYTALKQK